MKKVVGSLQQILQYLKYIVATGFVLSLLVLAGAYYWAKAQLLEPIQLPSNNFQYVVEAGASLASVSRDLESKKIIPSALVLRLYARVKGQQQIRRGEFLLDPGMNSLSLLNKLGSNDVVQYQVTLLEGWTYQQALEYLHSKKNIKATLKGLEWKDQNVQMALDLDHPEGRFFPDTYRYQAGESDADILLRAQAKLESVLQRLWLERAANLPYKNANEALVMASIIERETGVDREREIISGVFVRRLKQGMRLQTDPTVIYGMGDSYRGNIRRRDLKTPTPYNTYVIHGLPPTPIALAGERSIYAALHPDSGKSLFFVAKGDGSHQFSETLAQHNKAVQQYQIQQRRKSYRSAPAP